MLHILSNSGFAPRVLYYFDNAIFKADHVLLCICQSHSTLLRSPSISTGGHPNKAFRFRIQLSSLHNFNQGAARIRRKKDFFQSG